MDHMIALFLIFLKKLYTVFLNGYTNLLLRFNIVAFCKIKSCSNQFLLEMFCVWPVGDFDLFAALLTQLFGQGTGVLGNKQRDQNAMGDRGSGSHRGIQRTRREGTREMSSVSGGLTFSEFLINVNHRISW